MNRPSSAEMKQLSQLGTRPDARGDRRFKGSKKALQMMTQRKKEKHQKKKKQVAEPSGDRFRFGDRFHRHRSGHSHG